MPKGISKGVNILYTRVVISRFGVSGGEVKNLKSNFLNERGVEKNYCTLVKIFPRKKGKIGNFLFFFSRVSGEAWVPSI